MSKHNIYILHSFILFVFIISIALLGCDTPECCGFGCGILGGSKSASCNSSRPPEPFEGFENPTDIAVTEDGDFVVIDKMTGQGDTGAVMHVDQTTGDRTIISQFAPLAEDRTGRGPRFNNPNGIAVTPDGDFVVIDTDGGLGVVVHVDQTSGNRTIISDESTGSGPDFIFSRDIAVTPDGDFVVIDQGLGAVVLVDQTSGDRTILSDDSTGSGPGLAIPNGIAVTIDGNFVAIDIVTGLGGFGAVVHVDQTTGDRTIISDDSTGSGPGFDMPEDIAVTTDGDFVVIDQGLGAVVLVDQTSGDRTILSDDSTGSGPGFLIPIAIEVTIDGDFVVIERQAENPGVVHVDQTSGDRTIISDDNTGSGP